jgi:hypothetical protein
MFATKATVDRACYVADHIYISVVEGLPFGLSLLTKTQLLWI